MDPVAALTALAALLLLTAAVGAVLRRREGRVRHRAHDIAHVSARSLGLDPAVVSFGETATLLQFSTEYCTRCPAARRVLNHIAGERAGVTHIDVDLTHRPDVARHYGVLQTPTTLIVDGHGAVRGRIAGAPRHVDVLIELDRLREDAHA